MSPVFLEALVSARKLTSKLLVLDLPATSTSLRKTTVYGFEVTWVIECKHWSEAVDKLHVFALRQIVSDLGADRGILLCEKGFQRGAVEAANFTNIQLSSLAELKVSSRNTISNLRLQQMFDRSVACKER